MLRRELIKQGAGAALMLLGAAAYPAQMFAEPERPSNPFFIETDSNNPVFRSATLDLQIKDDEGQYFRGKGGLARHRGGLGIVTVNHVIRNRHDLVFKIPGHPLAKMDNDILRACQEQAGFVDKAVFMPLPTDYANLLEELARANIISPLSMVRSKVEIGELVAQPNTTRGFDLFEVKDLYAPRAEIMLESPSFVPVCKGKSGTPLLRVSGNQILPEVVGVVKNFPADARLNTDSNSAEYNCSLRLTLAGISEL